MAHLAHYGKLAAEDLLSRKGSELDHEALYEAVLTATGKPELAEEASKQRMREEIEIATKRSSNG
jgi:hypothetical protein